MKYSLRHITALPLTAWLLLSGCAGESYPGLTYDRPMSPDIINEESGKTGDRGIEIELYIAPDSFAMGSKSTRGTGPFVVPDTTRRDSNHYESSRFHVFAFRASPDDQGPLTYLPDYRRRSNDPTDQKVNCLIDNSEDYNIGVPARLDYNRSGRLHFLSREKYGVISDSTIYYNIQTGNIGYNFFAYYIDDFEPTDANTSRTGDGVCYNIDIDGTRDLMYGAAPRLTPDVLDFLIQKDNLQIDEERRNNILNNSYYTNYAAWYGVRPYISMRHALTRLRFQAFPADETCDSVTIESIEVQCRNKAHLWVVRPNTDQIGITFDNEYNYVPLKEAAQTQNRDSLGITQYVPLSTEKNTVNWKDGYDSLDWKKNPPTPIGGDLLVSTDSVFRMKLTYRQTLRNKDPNTGLNLVNRHTAVYDLAAPKVEESFDERLQTYMYKPGHTYHINIGVYGLRTIVVNTGLEGWEPGEDLPPNDEDEFDGNK